MLRSLDLPDAVAIDRPAVAGPVVVSVPHAGRLYPPQILAAARVPREQLERLEDAWCDRIAADVCEVGATRVVAVWARAVADCNRGEGQMAPAEVAPSMRPQFSVPGRKERAGLGVVPTRLADCGPLWRRPIDGAALDWRLDALHRPYHRILAQELDEARARFGQAVLIDLHSMPPIPEGQPGHGAGLVMGDRFGATAADWLIDMVAAAASQLHVPFTRNQPYAGGHIVRTHGRPGEAVHAIQLEIDRSLYLGSDRMPDSQRMTELAKWFAQLVEDVGQAVGGDYRLPQAAE